MYLCKILPSWLYGLRIDSRQINGSPLQSPPSAACAPQQAASDRCGGLEQLLAAGWLGQSPAPSGIHATLAPAKVVGSEGSCSVAAAPATMMLE